MNKILLAVILAGFGAQVLKLIIYWFKHKRLSWHDLVVTGGMPSSHSAFVVSLATIIFLEEGISTTFTISLVLAMIVIRDAFGVRRSVGEEGMVINRITPLDKYWWVLSLGFLFPSQSILLHKSFIAYSMAAG